MCILWVKLLKDTLYCILVFTLAACHSFKWHNRRMSNVAVNVSGVVTKAAVWKCSYLWQQVQNVQSLQRVNSRCSGVSPSYCSSRRVSVRRNTERLQVIQHQQEIFFFYWPANLNQKMKKEEKKNPPLIIFRVMLLLWDVGERAAAKEERHGDRHDFKELVWYTVLTLREPASEKWFNN